MQRRRVHFTVRGIVQGVGFRPFVYNLAHRFGLAGYVLNSSDGVHIEIEGPAETIAAFKEALLNEKPPRSEITALEERDVEPLGDTDFIIRESGYREGEYVLVSPDIATCEECKRELFDPSDRRYRYPFTNCTNCGPRFTIIEDIPYDRPNTTMKSFTMCPACQAEYDDPRNRRFHAQPNACPVCGPSLLLLVSASSDRTAHALRTGLSARTRGATMQTDQPIQPSVSEPAIAPENTASPLPLLDENTARTFSLSWPQPREWHVARGDEALRYAAELLRRGFIVGLKGLGGFHIACDARNDHAVQTLRARKRRPSKPFAVMFRDIDQLLEHCEADPEEIELLRSPTAPIVLLSKREPDRLAPSLAPGLIENGAMLPSTPLHHLLLNEVDFPLVMTSGNLSEEPIAADNEEAVERLGNIVDALLVHNRDIASRYDDSVLRIEFGKPSFIRRARSYAPYPVVGPFESSRPVLACGPELKCTFTLTRDQFGFVSQHLGDLSDELTFEHYRSTIALYERLFRTHPAVLACDMHPDYLSTTYALEREEEEGLPLVRVQHHHAHIAGVIAEHGIEGPVIGFAFDGTGYGPDGTIWGGETLIATRASYERFARLLKMPLPGGDAAIKKPYRAALAYLYKVFGEKLPDLPFVASIPESDRALIFSVLDNPSRSPLTSSMGRLFDVAAVIAGVGLEATYEGELAIRFEALAHQFNYDPRSSSRYAFEILDGPPHILDFTPLLSALVEDVSSGRPPEEVSFLFHAAVASATRDLALLAREETGLSTVALSGGVWQNKLLSRLAHTLLTESGFTVLTHVNLPPNDGCVSYGQAVVASAVPIE